MNDLFGNTKPAVIRTLGFYQPFANLMLCGKIETRWIAVGKKPPFPIGRYLFYSTLTACSNDILSQWCKPKVISSISDALNGSYRDLLNGYAIGIGDLILIRPLQPEDEKQAFVNYIGTKKDDNGKDKQQWALIFENVHRINPFPWKSDNKSLGKQGVGFLPDHLYSQIEISD